MNDIPFIKMHGLENDYLFLDAFQRPKIASDLSTDRIAAMCNRRRGVGADGVIILAPPTDSAAGASMRIFNADGAEAEMCGNGARCAVRLLTDRNHVTQRDFTLETRSGALVVSITESALVTLDMGEPRLDLPAIPVDPTALSAPPERINLDASRITVGHYPGVPVSTGNPHFVIPWPEPLEPVPLESFAPALQNAPAFPGKVNIHLLHPRVADAAQMRSYERGVGETRACGTGACAALVAGVALGMLSRRATISMPGGDLHIHWSEDDNHLRQTGPAEYVFEGVWNH